MPRETDLCVFVCVCACTRVRASDVVLCSRLRVDQGLGWRSLRGGMDGEAEGHLWDQNGDLPQTSTGDSACGREADTLVLEKQATRRATVQQLTRIDHLRQRIAARREVCWACARGRGE